MYQLEKSKLKQVLEKWSRIAELYAPQLDGGQVMLLPYEDSTFTMDYINFAFPVKEYIFSAKETLFNWSNTDGQINAYTPDKPLKDSIYFGVRACDVYGIEYMDHFYLDGYRDELYAAKRKAAMIVAVNCDVAGENCFCSSMQTGPFVKGGFDLQLTPCGELYLIEAATERGKMIIDACPGLITPVGKDLSGDKSTVERAAIETFKNQIYTEEIGKVLAESFDNLLWETISMDCISCTGCTTLCPTCTCFNAVEEQTGACSGCRVRYWDSCQSDSFTRNAGKHNPRSRKDRVRYRIYDKFKYIEDKFHFKGCSGCGRCIDVCPASINVVKIINDLTEQLSSDHRPDQQGADNIGEAR